MFYLFRPLGEKGRRARRGILKAQIRSWYFFQNMITKYTLRYNTLVKKFKIKINIIIDIKRLTENNIKWEVNTFAIIFPMKGLFVEVEVRDQKGVVFTGKDASELYANKMGA